MSQSRFLGIDYGKKRIGVAVSDESGRLAFPKIILNNDNQVFSKFRDIFQKENIGTIVVGESLDFKGQPNAIAQEIEVFIADLGKFGIPVFKEKEFLTSVEARKFHGPKSRVDASAAALILQRYLDRKNLSVKS
ncbi:MAG: Holliday junction resolvase RuvX [bacterium]|nr:Holliday junction resolvase RuvX [bacterium]